MRCFISQLMNGRTDEEILAERDAGIQYLKKKYGNDVVVLASFLDQDLGSPLKYLAESIKILADADICLFMPDWSYGRGCRLEHDCCIEYGIEVIYYGE